ncbi:MAG: histidine kinase [Saprospiraceae bacterium]
MEKNHQGETIKNKKQLYYHLVFWLLYFLYHTLQYSERIEDFEFSMFINLPTLTVDPLFVYLNLYWLIPSFLLKKRWMLFGFWAFCGIVLVAFFTRLYWYEVAYALYPQFITCNTCGVFSHNFFYNMAQGSYLLAFSSALRLYYLNVDKDKKLSDINQEKLHTELSFLKSQIHPHFFFNTLNNIYALSVQKSAQTPEMILKLSQLMDYLIYQSDSPLVPLNKEIKYMNLYLDLERLRFGKRLDLNIDITGNMEGKSIPPLLLLPFIENSFKHGTTGQLQKIKIIIGLDIEEDRIFMRVKNPNTGPSTMSIVSNGLGLKNVERRLRLLYQNDFSIIVKNDGKAYQVALNIPLTRLTSN